MSFWKLFIAPNLSFSGDFFLTVLYEYVILKLPDFVISSVVRLISSMVRLGWIADNGHRNIITCVSPLLKVSRLIFLVHCFHI